MKTRWEGYFLHALQTTEPQKVYKYVNNKEWIESTEFDSTDCICSVKAEGTYKEFVGVVTSFDPDELSLTFATHGDFLFRVDDSDIYEIGDMVLYDGKILNEEYIPSSKILRSIVGVVSGKVGKIWLQYLKHKFNQYHILF